jgi:hypothetical protein
MIELECFSFFNVLNGFIMSQTHSATYEDIAQKSGRREVDR